VIDSIGYAVCIIVKLYPSNGVLVFLAAQTTLLGQRFRKTLSLDCENYAYTDTAFFGQNLELFSIKTGCTYTVCSDGRCALRLRYVTKSAVSRDRPRTLNKLKTAVTAFIRNISQADMQKIFANKIKRVQACINDRGHHFQHLL
jgi:hypothetical protein